MRFGGSAEAAVTGNVNKILSATYTLGNNSINLFSHINCQIAFGSFSFFKCLCNVFISSLSSTEIISAFNPSFEESVVDRGISLKSAYTTACLGFQIGSFVKIADANFSDWTDMVIEQRLQSD
ncbi:hypothetical protein QTP88_001320 [Uroleucon formosanum]